MRWLALALELSSRSAAMRFRSSLTGSSRLVARVLGSKLAGEGVAENGLPERIGAPHLAFNISFKMIDHRRLIFSVFDDDCLLIFGRNRKRERPSFVPLTLAWPTVWFTTFLIHCRPITPLSVNAIKGGATQL
jgi:hypothetical protein